MILLLGAVPTGAALLYVLPRSQRNRQQLQDSPTEEGRGCLSLHAVLLSKRQQLALRGVGLA